MTTLREAIRDFKRHLPAVEKILDAAEEDKSHQQKTVTERAEAAVNRAEMMEQIMARRFSDTQSRGTKWAADKDLSKKPLQGHGTLRKAAIKAVKGTFRLNEPIRWDINKVGLRYARPVNAKRPFMSNPSDTELQDAMDLAQQVIESELANLSA